MNLSFFKKLFYCLLVVMLSSQSIKPALASPKLLFVTITSETCYSCQKLKPVLEELEYEYGSSIKFITLDVSTKASIKAAKQLAKNLGINSFFFKNLYVTPTIGILCSNTRKVQKTFIGETNKKVYQQILNKLLINEYHQLCSL